MFTTNWKRVTDLQWRYLYIKSEISSLCEPLKWYTTKSKKRNGGNDVDHM